MAVCSVSRVGPDINCVRPKDSYISLMFLALPENVGAEPSVELGFTERSQFVSPNRIISFPSNSKKRMTCSSLSKVSIGSLGGLYHERTIKGAALRGVTSTPIISNDVVGISSLTLDLKLALQWMATLPPWRNSDNEARRIASKRQ